MLAFEDDAQRTSNKRYYIPNVEIKDYNVMIAGKNFFDQPVKVNKVEKLLLVEEMTIQLAACLTISISKIITK